MEIIYFTLTAILLYLASDWILRRMETAAGKRFEKRSLIFFAILMTMAVTSFTLIRNLTGQLAAPLTSCRRTTACRI